MDELTVWDVGAADKPLNDSVSILLLGVRGPVGNDGLGACFFSRLSGVSLHEVCLLFLNLLHAAE